MNTSVAYSIRLMVSDRQSRLQVYLMKMKSLLLFVFVAIVCSVVFGTDFQGKCKPVDDFKNGCNNCNCKIEDGGIVCSEKTCPQRGNGTGLIFKCKPGCTFKIDCNMCTCNEEGTGAICTEIACAVRDSGVKSDSLHA